MFDPSPAGTYSGVGDNAITVDNDGGYGGARAADFVQLDVRFGYRAGPFLCVPSPAGHLESTRLTHATYEFPTNEPS